MKTAIVKKESGMFVGFLPEHGMFEPGETTTFKFVAPHLEDWCVPGEPFPEEENKSYFQNHFKK